LVAKGTGRAVFNLTTVNVGCQDEAVVTQVADVAYGSKCEILNQSRCFPVFHRKRTLIEAVGMSQTCQHATYPLFLGPARLGSSVRGLPGISHKGARPGPRLQAGHRLGQRNVGL
jgi:hypothetical protein